MSEERIKRTIIYARDEDLEELESEIDPETPGCTFASWIDNYGAQITQIISELIRQKYSKNSHYEETKH